MENIHVFRIFRCASGQGGGQDVKLLKDPVMVQVFLGRETASSDYVLCFGLILKTVSRYEV